MEICLTYFDVKLGPAVLKALPNPITNQEKELIEQIMDFQSDHGFFEFENDVINSANYIFEIKNEFARGNAERIMLSILGSKNLKDFSKFRKILKRYSEILKKTEELPIIFYKTYVEERDEDKFKNAEEKLTDILVKLHKEVKQQHNRLKIGNVFILGLDHVGKTSLIKELNNHEINPLGENIFGKVVRVVFENTDLDILDIGGSKEFKVLWKDNPDPPEAIVYILDYSKGEEHYKKSKDEFNEVMKFFFGDSPVEALPINTPVLILANKVKDIENIDTHFLEALLEPEKFNINYRTGYVSYGMKEGLHNNFKWIIEEFLNTINK